MSHAPRVGLDKASPQTPSPKPPLEPKLKHSSLEQVEQRSSTMVSVMLNCNRVDSQMELTKVMSAAKVSQKSINYYDIIKGFINQGIVLFKKGIMRPNNPFSRENIGI